MSKKKQPPEDWADSRRWEGFCQAKSIKETWPLVSLVTVKLEFPYGEFKTEEHNYGADNKAFFDYRCPCKCRQGLFELTGRVTNMVNAKESEYSDQLICRGIEEDGRLNCGLTMEYHITVRYKT